MNGRVTEFGSLIMRKESFESLMTAPATAVMRVTNPAQARADASGQTQDIAHGGQPDMPFAVQLDPASWLQLPPPEAGFGPEWNLAAGNPSQVVCHTLISAGAYDAVYAGSLVSSGGQRFRDVAVKLMKQAPEGAANEKLLLSFQVEAELLPGLSHPNVVPVYYVNADPSDGPVCILQVKIRGGVRLCSYKQTVCILQVRSGGVW
jgi:hypothetical protein